MPQLKFSLLGSAQVTLDDVPVSVDSRKALALLIYLAVTGEPQRRDLLATLLWPEQDQSQARGSLRHVLWLLKKAGAGPCLSIERDLLALQEGYWADVALFRSQIRAGEREQAISLYRGDFLAGFTLRDSPEFDDWQFLEADGLRRMAANALETLVHQCKEQGDYEQGLDYARRWLSLDPLHELIHRQLMALYAQVGQHAAALRQYEECVRILGEELGVPPDDETSALYEAIKTRQFPPTPKTPPSLPPGAGFFSAAPVAAPVATPQSPPVFHNLPAPLTSFVGRDTEIVELEKLLVDEGVRLITITGLSGIGKTRLALQVARKVVEKKTPQPRFPQGVLFVPLHALDSTSGIVSAIAEAAAFTFHSSLPPRQQLLDYLRARKMLLVLDNFEHLLDSTDLISEILTTAPHLTIVVTSREPLRIQGEWQWAVAGLPFPQEPVEGEALLSYDAVRLFVQSAQRIQPAFALAAAQQEVVRICRLVEGMPLGIELAAAWLKMMSCAQIAAEIEQNLAFLTTRLRNMPDRHRSMQAVFEQSWRLLPPNQQAVFQQLSVFRGGFQRDAAEQVAQASWSDLVALVEKSLLRVDGAGRYQLHELLRQFAAAKLATDPERKAETLDRYSDYYLRFLQAREEALQGPQQQVALSEIGAEIENIRVGWNWAVAQGNVAAIERSVDGLYHFYHIRSRLQESREAFSSAVQSVQLMARSGPSELQALYGKLLAREGAILASLGHVQSAHAKLMESLAIGRACDDGKETAFALSMLGKVAEWEGTYLEAEKLLRESLAVSSKIGDRSGIAIALHELAEIAQLQGNNTEAEQLARESLAISRELERPNWIAHALDMLGFNAFMRGEYAESEEYYAESAQTFEELGDHLGVSLALAGLGWVAWATGKLEDAAIDALQEKSLALVRGTGSRTHIATRLAVWGQITNGRGDTERAQELYTEGLAVAKPIRTPLPLAMCLNGLGDIARRSGDFRRSRRYLLEGLRVAADAHILPIVLEALIYLADLWVEDDGQWAREPSQKEKQHLRALELLALAQHHPSCYYVLRERAASRLAGLAEDLPHDLVAAAIARGKDADLYKMAMDILG